MANPTDTNLWRHFKTHYNSYSGADIVAQIMVPGDGPMILGELQTLSYSIHRENTPVRVVGHVSPVGFVKGPRTIAGSLIFTVFNEYAFYRLAQMQNAIMMNSIYPLGDMLPPFDIALSFVNEYGELSKMKIFGVSIIDEGGTMSIDDLVTESTMTYMARGIEPLSQYGIANQAVFDRSLSSADDGSTSPATSNSAIPASSTEAAYNTIPTSNSTAATLPELQTVASSGHSVRLL